MNELKPLLRASSGIDPPYPLFLLPSFYEKQATQNGLSLLDESSALPGGSAGNTDVVAVEGRAFDGGSRSVEARGRLSAEIERDRAGMQEAASTTVRERPV